MFKKISYILLGMTLMVGGTVLAAPYFTYQRTLLPETNNAFDLGTTMSVWRDLFVTQICLSGDCKSAWPTGGSGGAFSWTVNSWGNSTSTTLGFLNGFLSTASSTISSSLRLPSLTQGFLYTGSTGLVQPIASSSIKLSWFDNDSGFITSSASTTLLSDFNTWTGRNNFTYASTTQLDVTGTATSTFAGSINMTGIGSHLTTHGIRSDASDGIHFHANNWTDVANFGAGNTANVIFYGGVNIDGTTRLATGLTGLLKASSGTVSTASNGTDYTLISASACSAGSHVSEITAAGVITCSADTGSGGSGLASSTPWTFGSLVVAKDNTSVTTIATSTIKTSQLTNDAGFLTSYTSPYEIATTSDITASGYAYFTKTSGRTTLGSVSTSTIANFILPFKSYGASTSTTLGLLGGLFSTASSTFGSSLYLPSLTQGFVYTGTNGLVQTIASSSIALSWFNNDSGFLTAVTVDSPLSGSGTSGSHLTLDTSGSWTGSAGSVANALTAGTGLTSAGTYNGATTRTFSLDTANANSWSVLQTFNYSSSTAYSSFVTASSTQWIGGGLQACDATTGKLNWDSTTKQFKCDTDQTGGGGFTGAINSIVTTDGSGNLMATGTQLTVGNIIATTSATSIFSGNIVAAGDGVQYLGGPSSSNRFYVTAYGITDGNTTQSPGQFKWQSGTGGTNIQSGAFNMGSAIVFGWSGGDVNAVAKDTALSRLSAGRIAVGNGSGSDTSGGLSMAYSSTTYGSFTTASSTFGNIGTLTLSTTTAGCLNTGSTGIVYASTCASGLSSYDAWTPHWAAGFSATTSSIAVGTTTSYIASLTVASSTKPQLALSAGAGLAQWAFRNAGGNLYFSTTTVAGTATTSTSALTILGSNGNIGIGTTSPWGGLSIANSSISNYSSPLFFVSTSTIPTGQLFGIFATTTTLRLGAGTSNTLYPDVGTRIGVGLSSYLGYGGLLDQFTVNGRVNTQGWLSITCDTPGSVASTVIGNICNGWSYGETEPVSGSSLTTGVGSGYMFYRSSGMQTSGNGIGIYAGATGATNWITLATSTPVMEVTFRFGNTVGNSMSTTTNVMIGFTSVPQNSVDVTNAPANGCYLTASSTQQNWRAISRSASTETNVDTGIASTTLTSKGLAGFRKFRIEADSSHCAFYIQSTESSSLVKVANITTNIPTVVLSAGVQAGNRGVASSLTPVADMFRLRFWWRDTVPAL